MIAAYACSKMKLHTAGERNQRDNAGGQKESHSSSF